MASRSSKSTRQSMVKSKKQEGQADRETRAFLALQNRKISRKNDIEKKRGIPLMEISSNENENQNCKQQNNTEKEAKTEKRVDPMKEALKKWQKEKRLRQIQEKKTKKEPFRPVSNVSRQLSEFQHSFQNNNNQMNASKIKTNDVIHHKVVAPEKNAQKNVTLSIRTAAKRKTNPVKEKKTGTNVNRPTKRSSTRTMKTRSMATKTSTATSISNRSSTTSVPMETEDTVAPQQSTHRKDVPNRMARSRVNEKKASQAARTVHLPPPSQTVSKVMPIPNDFSFNVPAGVESFVFCGSKFKFTPLSPNSAQRFSLVRTPVKELPNETALTCAAENNNGAVEKMVMEDDTTVEMKDINRKTNNGEMDANYFRNMAKNEIDRLQSRCAKWENEQEKVMLEDVRGKIRTVVGQVQLLVTKKFKQFSGLLDLSEDPTAEKKTLVSDLQGFWEMMYIQVEDIDKKFLELEELKENNWEEKKVEVKKKNAKRANKAKKTASKIANNKVSEGRNKFREMRAQMKAKLQAEKGDEQDAFKIILTPIKNKKANADPGEPEMILTPVRRSTRKSQSCVNIPMPVVNLPENISVDLFGACKSPAVIQNNAYLSNLDDSMFLPCHTTPVKDLATADDLMVFSPTTPAQRV